MKNNMQAELNFVLQVAKIHAAEREFSIDAGEAERKAIAERFGILRLDALHAECKAMCWRKRGVSCSGRIRALLEQSCSVTLEPVSEEMDISFRALFWPASHGGELPGGYMDDEAFIDISGDDSPELFENNQINFGETILEYFALAINPYPKAVGVKTQEFIQKPEFKDAKPSPFHVLKSLKDGGE